eukprot:TRINITY_DN112431_c0_g1_i1.p1 TRINITY_DN112431_c0_g1~~TRINITY_DN112431_c0_g1_i1.p1  ORF type:complete len:403 (+),score=74.21 TRINITY_DN112431_c0_g1_i1:100-1308(+)
MAAAAASAACASDASLPLWSPGESRNLSDSASIAAAVCNGGRRDDSEERDCSTRASSECGGESLRQRLAELSDLETPGSPSYPYPNLAAAAAWQLAVVQEANQEEDTSAADDDDATKMRQRWADLSEDEEQYPRMEKTTKATKDAAAHTFVAAASASEYEAKGSYQKASYQQPRGRRNGNRSSGSSSSSSAWSQGSSDTWQQWGAASGQSWAYGGCWSHGSDSSGRSSGKKSSWQRHSSGSGASSSKAAWTGDASSWYGSSDWSAGQDWSTSRNGAAGSKGNGRRGKWQCQFFVGIEEEETFQVVRRLLGPHGKHVKAIAEKSGAKLRLRGRGSGFKEGPQGEESTDELMLCVSVSEKHGYAAAVNLVWEHLESIYKQYAEASPEAAGLQVRMHEGPRDGSF